MKTDSKLRHDVLEELQWDPGIDANEIGVAVKEGVVTLAGDVSRYGEKMAAERAVKRVYGVKAVANDLRVRIHSPMQRTDPEIATAALHVLKWDGSIPAEQITVTVREGHVILEGTVEGQYHKEAAGCAVRNLVGVKDVTNSIHVKILPTRAEVKEQIEAAFLRSAEIDARRVSVDTHDGQVVLRGHVRSWAERGEAERAAWAAPGVGDVKNELIVTP